jgi:hypothetical protein
MTGKPHVTGITLGLFAIIAETIVLWRRRGAIFTLDTVVHCTQDHLFTTWWIPGVSIKALRLLWWRLQYCPVGRHLALVTPVDMSTLTEDEITTATTRHDLRIP